MTETPKEELGAKMSLIEHLAELRKRLMISLAAVGVGFGVAWYFSDRIYQVLMLPLTRVIGENRKLIFTSPAEAFVTYMKVSMLAGVFAASPVIIWQIWKFAAPGLFRREQLYFKWVVFAGSFFFVVGALFGYFGVFPIGFKYFITAFETKNIEALITLKDYLSFASGLLFAFGVAFELPVFVFFLARIGIVTPQWLWKNFRWAILVIFIIAAIFTPPDAISQCIMGIPLTLLYLLAVGAAYLFGPKKKKDAEAEPESEPTEIEKPQ
jgi:sec-independent protein translocase protein TatC